MVLRNSKVVLRDRRRVVRKKLSAPVSNSARKHSLARMVRTLRAHLPEISERYKVKSLGVFGSYVRNEQKPASDLDVLVEFDGFVGLYEQIDLQNYLSDLLGVKIDLGPRSELKPYVGKRILSEVVWLQKDSVATDISHREITRKRSGRQSKQRREYLDYLKDLAGAMENVEQFVADVNLDQFERDQTKIHAVAWGIKMISVAAKRISSNLKRKYSDVPWKDFENMYDRMVRDHFDIELDIAWNIATREIPDDQPRVARILEEEMRRRGGKDANGNI